MRRSLVIEEKIVEEMRGLPIEHQKKVLEIVRLLKTDILHSISKCNRCDFKGRLVAQTFSGPCVN
ncbi:MAG: hypothetical protein HY805_01985 [Nitrospirae bacterium]|nr:hypothetical protein [Nitrospirota bacterium]